MEGCGILYMGILPISKYISNMSGSSIEPESNFTACQNSLSDHSFEGVTAFLHNLTKNVTYPFDFKWDHHLSVFHDAFWCVHS